MKNDPRFSQEVKIAKDKSASWGTRNPHAVDNVNVAQGPRTGNSGTPSKQKSFLSEKSDRGSYMAGLADMVSTAFGKRGAGMKPNRPASADPAALKSISPVTRTKRGPTKG